MSDIPQSEHPEIAPLRTNSSIGQRLVAVHLSVCRETPRSEQHRRALISSLTIESSSHTRWIVVLHRGENPCQHADVSKFSQFFKSYGFDTYVSGNYEGEIALAETHIFLDKEVLVTPCALNKIANCVESDNSIFVAERLIVGEGPDLEAIPCFHDALSFLFHAYTPTIPIAGIRRGALPEQLEQQALRGNWASAVTQAIMNGFPLRTSPDVWVRVPAIRRGKIDLYTTNFANSDANGRCTIFPSITNSSLTASQFEILRHLNEYDPGVNLGELIMENGSEELLFRRKSIHKIIEFDRGTRYSDIIIWPNFAKGGAEKFITQILKTLSYDQSHFSALIFLVDHSIGSNQIDYELPAQVKTIIVGDLFDAVGFDYSFDVAYCLGLHLSLLSVKNASRFHWKISHSVIPLMDEVYEFLSKQGNNYLYYFAHGKKSISGQDYRLDWCFDTISRKIDYTHKIVSDNPIIPADAIEIFGQRYRDRFLVIPAHVSTNPIQISRPKKNKILWASRIDLGKRGDLLPILKRELEKTLPQVTLSCAGKIADKQFESTIRECFGKNYLGPFYSFVDLHPNDYDLLIYTTTADGIPNIILEALAAGLPVVAPNVGGISTVVLNNVTGLLVPFNTDGDEQVRALVSSVAELYGQNELLSLLAISSQKFVAQFYSIENHRSAVREGFPPIKQIISEQRGADNFYACDPNDRAKINRSNYQKLGHSFQSSSESIDDKNRQQLPTGVLFSRLEYVYAGKNRGSARINDPTNGNPESVVLMPEHARAVMNLMVHRSRPRKFLAWLQSLVLPKLLDQYITLRWSGLFDPGYYLDNYPDVRASGLDPVMHYIRIGAKAGRNPNALFSTVDYTRKNDGVVQSKLNPLYHYIRYGWSNHNGIHRY